MPDDCPFMIAPPGGSILPGPMQGNPPDIFLNFASNQAYIKSTNATVAASPLLTVSRASSGTVNDTSGNWTTVGSNLPRISNLGLLVEENRTNSLRNNSMQGAVVSGALPTNWLIQSAAGLTTTVAALGTESGVDFIDLQVSGTAAGTQWQVRFESPAAIAAIQNQTWTSSLFAYFSGGSTANVTGQKLQIFSYTSAPAFLTAYPTTVSVPSVGPLGASRFSGISQVTDVTIASVISLLEVDVSNGQSINFTIRIGWPQLELGASATSPIRTTSVAVTRAADAVTLTSVPAFGSAYSQYVTATFQAPQAYNINQVGIEYDDGTSANRAIIRRISGSGNGQLTTAGGTGVSLNAAAFNSNVLTKFAGAYAAGDQAFSQNGSAPITGAAAILPSGLNAVDFGSGNGASAFLLNGFISQAAIWSTQRVPNTFLQAITQ